MRILPSCRRIDRSAVCLSIFNGDAIVAEVEGLEGFRLFTYPMPFVSLSFREFILLILCMLLLGLLLVWLNEALGFAMISLLVYLLRLLLLTLLLIFEKALF